MVSEKELSPSSHVVSVRPEESMLERLDALVERVGRARRFSLRLLIGAVSPALKDTHWAQVVTHCEDDALDRKFWEIMAKILGGEVSGQVKEDK